MKNSFIGESGRTWEFDSERQRGRRGGFGAVYEGQGQDGEPVAVKVIELQGRISGQILRKREKEIAERLAGVDASFLIRVLDSAETPESVYLVMELAEESLAARLESLSALLQEATALEILGDVTTGLRELHQAAIIHRDLKPDNILLHMGSWKLGDFGLARDTEIGTQQPTFVGWGSRPYMAPETWRGQSPTFKTDLYSLGCLAHELLAGMRPFPGPNEEDFRRQHLEEPPPPLDRGSPRLRRLILRLLSKDPAERPQDARAVAELLETLVVVGEASRDPGNQLAELALQHETEKADEQARSSAAQEEAARRDALHKQGAADLEQLVQDAVEEIRQQIPEVTYDWTGSSPKISGPDATLAFRLYPGLRFPAPDTAMIIGEVIASNRRGRSDVVLADIVFEDRGDGGYRWQVYRFRAQGGLLDYPLGPIEGLHGLDLNNFVEHRRYMSGGATHIFVTQRGPLAISEIRDFYAEALALPSIP